MCVLIDLQNNTFELSQHERANVSCQKKVNLSRYGIA